jgi:hypothetical protein
MAGDISHKSDISYASQSNFKTQHVANKVTETVHQPNPPKAPMIKRVNSINLGNLGKEKIVRY